MIGNPEYPRYYVSLKDGYKVGDIYRHGDIDYEVVEIEAFNQLMLVEEIFVDE